MASVARPSIFEVRGDGLPRYARSDGNVSWQAKRVHHWLCHGEQSAAIKDPVMASAARPSILDVRGDGLPHFARSDGIFDLLFTVCVQFRVGFRKLALARSQTWPRPLAYPRA